MKGRREQSHEEEAFIRSNSIFCVVLATIIFALDRMDVISEGVALFINVSLMALYWCIASILNKDPK